MNHDTARSIAEDVLDRSVRPGNDEIVILDDATIETATHWIFFYNARAFVERGVRSAALAGNAPVFVSKQTGQAAFGRTDIPIEDQIQRR